MNSVTLIFLVLALVAQTVTIVRAAGAYEGVGLCFGIISMILVGAVVIGVIGHQL